MKECFYELFSETVLSTSDHIVTDLHNI